MLASVRNFAMLFACIGHALTESLPMPKAPVEKWCPSGPKCGNCDCSSGEMALDGSCCCHPSSTGESPQACQMLLCNQVAATADVMLYRTDPDNAKAKQIAAQGWFDSVNHPGATGSPFGGFYRRCMKPEELAKKKTCDSIHLYNYNERFGSCEANSPAFGIFGKGEKVPIELAMNTNIGKIEKVFQAEGTKDGFATTPTALRRLTTNLFEKDPPASSDQSHPLQDPPATSDQSHLLQDAPASYDQSVLLRRTPSQSDEALLLQRTPSQSKATQAKEDGEGDEDSESSDEESEDDKELKEDEAPPLEQENEQPKSWSAWVSSKAKRVEVEIGTSLVGTDGILSLAGSSTRGVFYVIDTDGTPMSKSSFQWSSKQPIEWISCETALRKDKFFHMEAVFASGICESGGSEGGGGWWRVSDGKGSSGEDRGKGGHGGGGVGTSVVIGLSVGAILLLSFAAYSTYCTAGSGSSKRDVNLSTEMSYIAD